MFATKGCLQWRWREQKLCPFLVQKDFGMQMHVAEEIVAQEKTWKVRH
jgi:hypothetical protein